MRWRPVNNPVPKALLTAAIALMTATTAAAQACSDGWETCTMWGYVCDPGGCAYPRTCCTYSCVKPGPIDSN